MLLNYLLILLVENNKLKKSFPNSPIYNSNKSCDLITFVKDRPGHDFKYSINSDKILNDAKTTVETFVNQQWKTANIITSQKKFEKVTVLFNDLNDWVNIKKTISRINETRFGLTTKSMIRGNKTIYLQIIQKQNNIDFMIFKFEIIHYIHLKVSLNVFSIIC